MSANQPRTAVRAAVAGLGLAGRQIVELLDRCEYVDMVAVADNRADARAALPPRDAQLRSHGSVDALAGDPDVDAVWVATPTHLHLEHTLCLLSAGKHVVVDKPMAATLDECSQMISCAAEHDRVLLAGGARSFNPAFQAMAELLDSGRVGMLRALNSWAFTSWLVRPREPYELDPARGGGIVLNQGPHVLDVFRYLEGGQLRSIHAALGDWLPERGTPGYFTGLAEFESGVTATFSVNGYGYLEGGDLVPWADQGELARVREQSARYRDLLHRGGGGNEREARDRIRYGPSTWAGTGERPWTPTDAGLVIASCDLGEIRQSAYGLQVIDGTGVHEIPVNGADERAVEAAELCAAIDGSAAPTHDGAWGLATLEAVLAILTSARERRDISLVYQVGRRSGHRPG